ncbi:hypothetical protein FRC17_003661, partial [Serendipita sp. 399]
TDNTLGAMLAAIAASFTLFATPIMVLQFIACAVSVFLGVGLNSVLNHGRGDNGTSGRGGAGHWEVAQPQCNSETRVIIFGRKIRFWEAESLEEVTRMPAAERIVILVCYGIIIFLPFLCSFVCLYLPETGTLRAFASAFHQEKRTNKFALFAFFILSNAWTGLVIYATEKQIMENKVLPGELQWGSGQILAILLCGIPLLGCINILLTELGNHNPTARRYIKRTRLHRVFGIRYESGTPSAPATPRSGTPRRSLSGDAAEAKDLETGLKSPGGRNPSIRSSGGRSSGVKSPTMKDDGSYFPDVEKAERSSRRLSKRDRYQPKSPEENLIVSPGEDSGEEDWPGSPRPRPKRPRMNSREPTLVNTSERPQLRERTKSTGSIASQSVKSFTGSVKVIVRPDGQMNRVLSRRSSMAAESVKGRRREEEEERPRRRLSKSRPTSRGVSPSRSKRSRSEDGYWSAAEDIAEARGRHQYSRSDDRTGDQDRETIRENRRRSDSNKNDDPLSKYYWDASRGWLEKK